MAQAFSSALDSAFMLDSDVNQLSQTIDQKYVFGPNKPDLENSRSKTTHTPRANAWPKENKRRITKRTNQSSVNRKQQMMIQSRELEALQERIREAEERLKHQGPDGEQSTGGEQHQTAGKDESS